ncbi:uncharacterized protein LOC105196081 isoform X3 [Solenopsis invicta]|uniref:uncharacterized protein LOC105196081 isoform X3 n=1 Tax=Solenopsis invicta TaxID=13686 RepID=UPI00193CFAC3|nr:uncharacterized protein LOC105196081 isoform X3 [Solenopsis invicta]XP_025987757.2 uncharacterized protein LOC105196081 isoform X3 [Solenopsis invicta]
MILSETLTDSSFLAIAPSKIEFKPPMTETRPSTMVGGRRVKHATSNETTTTSMVTGGVTNRSDNNVVVSTVQPTTTQQKVRRIFEEQARWQESGSRRRVKSTSSGTAYCLVNNYNIVASRGELARNNRAASETTTTTSVTTKRRTSSLVNGRIHSKEETARSGILAAEESRKLKDVSKDSTRSGISRGIQRGIIKSASVPKDLKEGLPVRERTLQRVPEEGILKKSSAFLASLAHHHPSSKLAERNLPDDELAKFLRPTNSYELRDSSTSRYTSLKRYFLTDGDDNVGLCALRPSPSVQTLSTSLKKKSVGVKKSVSFSSDTSFQEKRVPYRKPAVHEVKVYRKGVLQDHVRKETIKPKVPPSWETPSGGPTALLRAAREADDTGLKEIVAQARKVGLKGMDVNVVDSSGRTAISYMAGNGAATMLELALSFEGVDPNLPDNEGNTPLHFAAQAGQTECLNILLERCPDIEVDARNTLGFTPLMKAALQGRTKCAKILLFAGANPTLRDHGRGLRAEQWARFCGRYVCAEMIERFARHRLLERTTSCRWGSEPELAAKVLQGKVRIARYIEPLSNRISFRSNDINPMQTMPGDAYTYDASAAILGIEVENKKSLPHHLQPRSNLLSGVATHQRGSLREQSGSTETVTCCKKSSATVERASIKVRRSSRNSKLDDRYLIIHFFFTISKILDVY